jgi:glycosyltransferase involved in cell wall biosynthesis
MEQHTTAARPLRVLYLTSVPWLPAQQNYTPGTSPDPFELWQCLSQQGVDVQLLDAARWPLNPLAKLHSFYQSIDPYRSLKVLFARRDYDLVLVSQDGGAAIPVSLRRLVSFKTPILIWDLSPAAYWRIRQRIQDHVIPRIDAILAVHSGQAAYVAERWGVHIPVLVVGYPIDTNFWHPRYSETPEHILSVGDDPGRDFPTLLAAMDGVASKLLIRTSQDLSGSPANRSSVELIGSQLDYLTYRSTFARSRFIVLPLKPHTLNASGITTLAEAFALGKAVIVTDSDGVRDFLLPGDNCLTVPPGDPDALHSTMQRLLREPETCARLGQNARRYAEEHFSRSAFATRFADVLREFIAMPHSTRTAARSRGNRHGG